MAPLLARCCVCARCTEAGRCGRGKPVIMSLARGGKSQYSKNKNGFETWGGHGIMYSRADHKWDVRLTASLCLHVLSAALAGSTCTFIKRRIYQFTGPDIH